MSSSRFTVRQLTTAAVIAAVYTVLTTTLPIPQYGGIQLRVAEAMTVLPFFFPEAIAGLTVGCFLSNVLMSPIPLTGSSARRPRCWRPCGPGGCPIWLWLPCRR